MSIPEGEINGPMYAQSAEKMEIVKKLVEYKREADMNRKGGLNPRDAKWSQNLDLYHNRYDFSAKAEWQSKNVMPEVPAYVDRFAAAMKDAVVNSPNFYTVVDPYDKENDLAQSIKSMTDVWLSICGKNHTGTPLDFSAAFEEQMKLGALMGCCGRVLWKNDVPGGRVAVEAHDPRFYWMDHTGRGLYRVARTEIDLADVARMAKAKSSKGSALYDLDEIGRLVSGLSEDSAIRKELSGTGDEQQASSRKPITMDEYIATVCDSKGNLIMDNEMAIVCNDEYLLRGPEPIPFTHGQDFMLWTPLVTVPLSPYGRSYMEDFGDVARVFTELTNLILDATYMSAMNAYVMVPAMLKDPTQASTGIWPNKTFFLEEGYSAEDFAKAIELGSLDPGAIQVWDKLKGELADASGMNEIGLGQLPDKTHIAATAVSGAQQSSSAILRSVAQTIETRFLDPMLDLVWKTGLQHAKLSDQRMASAVGDQMYRALITRKRELIRRPITFQARGISGLINKQQKLQSLMSVMQVLSANPNLLAAFMQRVDINKLVDLLFSLSNVDITKLSPTQRDSLIQSVAQPMIEAGQQGTPSSAGLNQMGNMATMMGVSQ